VGDIEDWRIELKRLAGQLDIRMPLLYEKRSRWHRPWVLASLLAPIGAWGGAGRIVICSAFLAESRETARYLLAHELGHVVRRHSERIGLPLVYLLASGALIYLFRHAIPHWMVWTVLFSWMIAAGSVLWTARGFAIEYEADEVAVRGVGLPGVRAGIQVMAKYEGGKLSAKRVARLKALDAKFGLDSDRRPGRGKPHACITPQPCDDREN